MVERVKDRFGRSDFTYDARADIYTCANETVRIAWAMLRNGADYDPEFTTAWPLHWLASITNVLVEGVPQSRLHSKLTDGETVGPASVKPVNG
jgi:hypothetical protein